MNLKELSPIVGVRQIEKLYKEQFSKTLNVSNLSVTESKQLLTRTKTLLSEFSKTHSKHNFEKNSTYLRLNMVKEAALMQIDTLDKKIINEGTGARTMDNKYITALKAVVSGKKLSESRIKSLGVSYGLQSILESRKTAIKFMRSLVENKRKNNVSLMEGEISDASTIIAAQSIADDIQSMVEKIANIQYKELPALHDSIRNTHGASEAQQFSDSVTTSMSTLTQNLEEAKNSVNSAVNVLTGEESGMDLDIGDEGLGDELGDDDDVDLGDEFQMDFEEEPDLEAEADLTDYGRERR